MLIYPAQLPDVLSSLFDNKLIHGYEINPDAGQVVLFVKPEVEVRLHNYFMNEASDDARRV